MTFNNLETHPATQPNPGPQGRVQMLKRFVDSLINSLPERAGATEDQFGLVYLGNVHDAIPRLLILDQGLRLEERCVWQVMRISITDPGRPASLLTQNQLASQCCVDIKTMRRYLHGLRATRWITRCAMVRGRGTVWSLHDEPLSIADTLLLDSGYMQFVDECALSQQKRLRELGRGILDTLREDIRQGRDYSQPVTQLEQASRRFDALTHTEVGQVSGSGGFFAIAPEFSVQSSSNSEHREIFPMGGHGEILPVGPELSTTGKFSLCGKFVPEEKSPCAENFPACGSSNNLNIINKLNTTTTKTNLNPSNTPAHEENFSSAEKFSEAKPTRQSIADTRLPHPEWVAHLKWPARLKEAERLMVLPALTARDFETAQYLLNYLSDRLQAASRGETRPVPNPVAYLIQIAALHSEGKLMPSSWGVRDSKPSPTATPEQTQTTNPHVQTSAVDLNAEMADLKRKMRW